MRVKWKVQADRLIKEKIFYNTIETIQYYKNFIEKKKKKRENHRKQHQQQRVKEDQDAT